jgi:hypothetical protein
MSKTWRVPTASVPMCPGCQREPSFIGSWTFRGTWGYTEVRTFECPEHGPIFGKPQAAVGVGPERQSGNGPESGDRDSLVAAPRKPMPTLNVDAMAIPEPDPN